MRTSVPISDKLAEVKRLLIIVSSFNLKCESEAQLGEENKEKAPIGIFSDLDYLACLALWLRWWWVWLACWCWLVWAWRSLLRRTDIAPVLGLASARSTGLKIIQV